MSPSASSFCNIRPILVSNGLTAVRIAVKLPGELGERRNAMKTMMERDCRAGAFPASTLLALAALLAVLFSGSTAVYAQDSGQPARAIRLSYVDGKVQLSQDNQTVTDQAVMNTPLLEGMTLTTADDGRAEIQFEDGSVARISPDSSLTLKVLRGQGSSADAEMDLNSGLAYFELQDSGQAGQIRVRFGDSVVTGSGFTVLRVKDDTPPGELAVFSGNAHLVRSGGLGLEVHGGESATLSNTDPNGYELAESITPDSWDQWNSDRDQALSAEASSQTNAPNDLSNGQSSNPAWSDLDASGTWYNVPDQGYVWSPYDAANAGFDPYGNGDWIWTPGFGYTWASAYPWGYLPYSCGAWNYYNGFGWGWAPGFGGCTPWWGMGFYGGPFIGIAPSWYLPVRRPIGPRVPHPGHPLPMITVHRRSPVMNAGLPPRDGSRPVAIHGYTVMGLRPLPESRTGYERASSFASRPGYSVTTPAANGGRSGFVASRPAYSRPQSEPGAYGASHGYTPAPIRGMSQPSRSYSAPQSHYSGGSAPHPSGGGEYHGGGGGGGGGVSHGGGGGGGGGHR